MFRRKAVRIALAVFALGCTLPGREAAAQNTTGNIVGTVSDPSGAVVANASVTITNKSTNDRRTATTSDSGDYQVLQLAPGLYRLDVDVQGFKHYTRDPVEVQVELTTRANIDLVIGSSGDTITVTEQAPIIQSENATLGQVVQGRAVTEIPLNGRNVLALVGLVPGVVPQGSSSSNLTGQNVFAAGNYQIGGGTSNQSSTLYDGVAVNVSYGNATMLVPSQDAVQEFRVQTSNNTAEYGNYTGGVVNITTKSGSNAIHGTVYEYVRNTMFNAMPYFARHDADRTKWLAKNPYHQNQFGANVAFPIIRDKLFGFFDYQGYRQALAQPYVGGTASVPTAKMKAGDFSEWCNTGFDSSGKCLPLPTGGYGTSADQSKVAYQIYDPCTGTSTPAGGTCPNQSASTARAFFPYNQIPANRISTVAKNVIGFPYWANPNATGNTNAGLGGNFRGYAKAGGENDQYNARLDFVANEKQRMFGRYTLWDSRNIGAKPYNNGLIAGDPISPEAFKTRQLVFGDTYLFSPTLIGDIRVGWLRWNYVRTPGTLGLNPTTIGLPSYMGQISDLNRLPNSTTMPTFSISGINQVNTGYIFAKNNNYSIAPVVSKTWKGHTFRMGADLRRMEQTYFQNNNPGGTFSFDSVMTASSPTTQATTGQSFASFLLGYMSGGSVQISNVTYYQIYYQGYYFQDNWTVTPKLTLNIGLRYEIPGEYRERHNNQVTFNPTAVNSALGSISIALPNGASKQVLGAYDLVASPQHPAAGLRNEHFTNFSPRIGLAYRLNEKTVIRAGWGKFMIPGTLQFPESPTGAGNAFNNNNVINTINNNVSPAANIDNPLPGGLVSPPGRSPNYQRVFLGSSINTLYQDEEDGLTYQWNVAVQRQLPLGIALEAAYTGLHGKYLPLSVPLNQVPLSVLNAAYADPTCNTGGSPTANCFLTRTVTNPFPDRTVFTQGVQQNPTIAANQLFRPFPQFGGITNVGSYTGVSNYNSLQAKLEKRFNQGGVLLGSYTFSKLMTNAESLTSWLETQGSAGGYQNTYNLGAEYSLSGYDSRQRLVVSYVYQLPFGRGQHWASGVTGVLDKLVSGYGVNGVTTLQKGFPMGITSNVTNYTLAGTLRPNVVAGCNKTFSGPIQQRLGDKYSTSKYFNTACFTQPPLFTFGNQSRQDASLRNPGIANYDLAIFKDTHMTEKVVLQLRAEGFNIFNRVQFGASNGQIGAAAVGTIGSQINTSRTFQMAGRINF